ncbi:MurR/RpiR family transcriptional regulator [Wenjunlia tyrosinilytica]|uniref:RpiR family transcriptional regulator n=1 Tax=Wenjunlia tyrosinilytica TaxID=1544741 RepID=A0A918E0A5_9ACTN|nr:MurR/RpiR family transcriptional regulator [Wenjunlia tyrosinilytica]GGO96488.1 RpiR family transcriptional regulator [Wenjunlia tyrosinilytica]
MAEGPIAERLTEAYSALPEGERAIVRVLLDDYPYAALESLRSLAARASVSPPTATRLFARLGWDGYADFQKAIRSEAREEDRSRLRQFVSGGSAAPSTFEQAADTLRSGLSGTLGSVSEPVLTAVAELLMGSGAVWTIGGPLSELAAEYLARQLAGLRPGVSRVPGPPQARARTMVDIGPRHTIVAYDFRRYSAATARFVAEARKRGAHVVLVTDAWDAPPAPHADHLIALPREAAGPIAPLTYEIAVTELVLVGCAGAAPGSADRLDEVEALTHTLG